MDSPLKLPSPAEVAHSSFQFTVSFLRNLDQEDIQSLLVAEPSFANCIAELPRDRFPLVQQLSFNPSIMYPIRARSLYESVRVTENLPSTHPVSKAILDFLPYVRNLSFGFLDVDAVEGTLLEKISNEDAFLETLTVERLTFNPFQRRTQQNRVAPLRVKLFRIEAFTFRARNRIFHEQIDAIVALLNGVQSIGQLSIPDRLLLWPTPVKLLLENAQNVEHFSLQRLSLDLNQLRDVVLHATTFSRALIFVPFGIIRVLSRDEVRRLYGGVMKTIVGIGVRIGVPVDLKILTLLYKTSYAEIRIEQERVIIDASTIQTGQRTVVFTSPSNRFPANGLRRFTPLYNTVQAILVAIGQIDLLDMRNCSPPAEGRSIFEEFYCDAVRTLMT